MSLRESQHTPLRATSKAHHSQHVHTYIEPWEVGVLYYKMNLWICSKHKSTNHSTCDDENYTRTHSHTKHIAWLTNTNPTNTKTSPRVHNNVGNIRIGSNHAYAEVATYTRTSDHHTENEKWPHNLVPHIIHIIFVHIIHKSPLFSSPKCQICTKCPTSPKMHFAYQIHVHLKATYIRILTKAWGMQKYDCMLKFAKWPLTRVSVTTLTKS